MELVKAGVFVAAAGLKNDAHSRRIVSDGVSRTVIDGPFAESRELIAGFSIWEVKDMDEAMAWAKRSPFMPGMKGEMEIRPFYEAARSSIRTTCAGHDAPVRNTRAPATLRRSRSSNLFVARQPQAKGLVGNRQRDNSARRRTRRRAAACARAQCNTDHPGNDTRFAHARSPCSRVRTASIRVVCCRSGELDPTLMAWSRGASARAAPSRP